MTLSPHDSLLLLALLVAGVGLLAIAPTLKVPYPILLVLGGLGLGFVPGVPHIDLAPELVLIGVLPPLLYSAAFFTPLRELRRNLREISSLALGLVLATMVAVATVAHLAIPGMSWPSAFVLGAIVAPTDPIAATAIAERVGIPRRLVSIIEGESLINDATALVAYRFAVVAVVTGSFSFWHASGRFVVSVVGGIGIGLGVGFLIRQVRRRLDHSPTEIAVALSSGYLAYLPAEALDVSAVLAAVTVGVYVGWFTPELTNARTRLQGQAVWEIVIFVLNALLFALVGLQLRPIIDGISNRATSSLLRDAALVCAAVIVTRILWVFPATYASWVISRRRRADGAPPWRRTAIVAWTGMRGAVTLAAALALPFTTDSGEAFAQRNLIVFLAFSVILVTLVLQGLTLPSLVRLLGVDEDGADADEEVEARIHAAEAALRRLEELSPEEWVRDETAERLRGLYGFRRSRFLERSQMDAEAPIEQRSQDYQRLARELLAAQRSALLDLRRLGRIDDSVLQRVQRELDLEDERLDQ